MAETLLATKLNIPPVPAQAVQRKRLIDYLNESTGNRLILISAPAGFGKTTLISMWAGQVPMTVAWLTLEKEDNDLARFLAYVIAAIQKIEPGIGKDALAMLLTRHFPPYENILTSLLNDLESFQKPIVLILDDYHLIYEQVIHKSIAFLLDHLPPQAYLVLASRADPPLPLSRLRARGQLVELRQSDLRFTTEEARVFLNEIMNMDLSPEDVAALEARTEGWVAGLQMAALSLQGRSPYATTRSEFIQAFTGSHRYVLDFLVEEVLDQQPPALQEFLLKTSILDRLSGSLCDSILGKDAGILENKDKIQIPDYPVSGSQSVLEYMEAANLFIVPLDDERRWYRYHRLFSDLLRKRLLRTHPELVPSLHRRASAWHEQNGWMSDAIDHALSAQDFERAASLIEENYEATLMRSEVTTFINWLDQLPDEWVRSRPTLCFFHAWTLLMSGRSLDIVEQRLQDMVYDQEDPTSNGILAGRMAALRAYYMLFQLDVPRAAELAHQALEHLPESDLFLRGIMTWIISLVRLADGGLQDGKQALEEVVRMGQEMGNPLITVGALCDQSKLQIRQGRLHRAKETLEQALQFATGPQGQWLPIASEALIGLGNLEGEWNNLETAADYLTRSIELAKRWSEMAAFDAYFPLARVRLAQGDVEGARQALATARQIAQRSEATQVDDFIADLQEAYFSVTQGDIARAVRWAEKRGLLPDPSTENLEEGFDEGQDYLQARLRKYEHLLLARLFILQRRSAEALDLLESLLGYARQHDRVDLMIQIQILRALAFQLIGHDTRAMEAISEAISLAEPGGYIRTFIDEGEPVAGLLREAASRGIAPGYVTTLLEAFGGPVSAKISGKSLRLLGQSYIEPLSERELDVLRLLAGGMSNPEIAETLVIAVSTVRSHCKSIYAKLDVHKRWDAVQRAKELGLL